MVKDMTVVKSLLEQGDQRHTQLQELAIQASEKTKSWHQSKNFIQTGGELTVTGGQSKVKQKRRKSQDIENRRAWKHRKPDRNKRNRAQNTRRAQLRRDIRRYEREGLDSSGLQLQLRVVDSAIESHSPEPTPVPDTDNLAAVLNISESESESDIQFEESIELHESQAIDLQSDFYRVVVIYCFNSIDLYSSYHYKHTIFRLQHH